MTEQIVLGIDVTDCPVLEPPESAGLPDGCRVRINDDPLPVAELAGRIGEIFEPREADRACAVPRRGGPAQL